MDKLSNKFITWISDNFDYETGFLIVLFVGSFIGGVLAFIIMLPIAYLIK